MLKIKDKIDLKDLEKFGYKYLQEENCYEKNYTTIEIDDDVCNIKNARKIYVAGSYMSDVYDLIQAGLVEKVSDK